MVDNLFLLVKSLDKNEKGYFKKFAARYGEKSTGNDYLKLFDLLDKADEYNEEPIKKHFAKGDKKFNLSAQKNYLYAQLMRCLRSYHTANNTNYKLTENLLDVQNLMDKGLDDQAMDLINDSIRKAQQSYNISMEYQFKATKMSLMIRHIAKYPVEAIKAIKVEVKEVNEQIQKGLVLEEMTYEMKVIFDEVISVGTLTAEIKAKADAVKNHPYFTEGLNWGYHSKGKIYTALYLYSCIISDDNDALKYLKLTNEMFKEIELDTKVTSQYLANISNIILIALNMELMDEAEHQLHVLHSTRFKDPALEIYRQKLYSKNQLMYLTVISQQRKMEHAEVLDAENNLLACNNPLIGNNNMMSCFYLSILFYVVGDRDKCLHWLEKTIAHENVSFMAVPAYARLLVALVHYEQNNLSLMESALNNTQYFIKKNNIVSDYLKQVISYLSKLQHGLPKTEKQELLADMLPWLEKVNQERRQEDFNYLLDFNLLIWCRACLNKTTYAEELRSNRLANMPETATA
ncbi:MAG TPA: hypothetical protein VK174_15930 [Chitinophagales bacterium]|nr:hypothetical protein [Chitinophagales bacterium]